VLHKENQTGWGQKICLTSGRPGLTIYMVAAGAGLPANNHRPGTASNGDHPGKSFIGDLFIIFMKYN
jgi:hypothetical protein